jgi:hypothetical protein
MSMANPFYDNPPPDLNRAAIPSPEQQTANAAMYLSHQAFHIRKALERIADALEKKAGP